MILAIDDQRIERLARRLAAATNASVPDAVARALEDQLARLRPPERTNGERAALDAVLTAARALPVLDERPVDELLG